MRLCKLINRETNLLVLDEPTNHLDADAKAELKRALKDYKGSILMVCHEMCIRDRNRRITFMSILNVEHLSHGFGDRAIFQDVSFRLLKGEHIGLVGANGEGKSTFFKIVTDRMMPDEGKIELSLIHI